ncbi:RING-H2 finger protein ATL74-like [Nymphaea colorata]|uniref:RING-type domain-containing protein n=1 Tax=Nymphaea colorata TaxID=210225 RepID=A0A5K1G5F1_9MAGN|nr:RING-H2 finger protein ATL74-like [Nymphaea colorata]
MNKRIVGIATQVMVMAIIISIILLFIGIGVLVFIHICVVGRAIRRGLSNIGADRNIGVRDGMSKDELERLPCFHYGCVGEKGSPVPCAVCLESFETGDKCRLLPLCKHSFHAECVDLWLLKTPFCPICRSCTLLKAVDDLELGSGRGPVSVADELGTAQPIAIGIPVSPDPSSLAVAPLTGSPIVGSTPQVSTVNEMVSAPNS